MKTFKLMPTQTAFVILQYIKLVFAKSNGHPFMVNSISHGQIVHMHAHAQTHTKHTGHIMEGAQEQLMRHFTERWQTDGEYV